MHYFHNKLIQDLSVKTCLLIGLMSVNALAEEAVSTGSGTTENRKTTMPYISTGSEKEVEQSQALFTSSLAGIFPLLGDAAREKGYNLPLAFGLSLNHTEMKQAMDVSDVRVQFYPQDKEVSAEAFFKVPEAKIKTSTNIMRLDLWVLPFMNVYGILGETKADVDLDFFVGGSGAISIGDPLASVIKLKVCGVGDAECRGSVQDAIDAVNNISGNGLLIPDIKTSYAAPTVGLGTTFAAGVHDFFGMYDINYTETDMGFTKNKATSLIQSTRVGWNGSAGIWSGQIWVGAMYQDSEQDVVVPFYQAGKFDDAAVRSMEAVIHIEPEEKMNYVIGGTWAIFKDFEVLAEYGGFAERRQFMFQATLRF